MIKYTFTGQLSPRPKGTEHAMCGLSGEVFLAADVEAWQAEVSLLHAAEITRLQGQLATAKFESSRLKKQIEKLEAETCPTCLPERVCPTHG